LGRVPFRGIPTKKPPKNTTNPPAKKRSGLRTRDRWDMVDYGVLLIRGGEKLGLYWGPNCAPNEKAGPSRFSHIMRTYLKWQGKYFKLKQFTARRCPAAGESLGKGVTKGPESHERGQYRPRMEGREGKVVSGSLFRST